MRKHEHLPPPSLACRKASRPDSEVLLKRIRGWTLLFILGLALSGATAIPLERELVWLDRRTGASLAVQQRPDSAPAWATWLTRVRSALHETGAANPFLFYGTDWLAFGHFAIAIAFIGAFRDPARNSWLFTFGMIACVLVVPYALIFGAVRGIPLWWRGIDCSFGVFGLIPLSLCKRWTKELETRAPWSPRTEDHG